MAGQMDRVRKVLASDEIVNQFIRIQRAGTRNLEPLGTIAINLGRAFANVAEAAGPSLARIIDYLAKVSGEILDLTRNQQALGNFFNRNTDSLFQFVDLVRAAIGFVTTLFSLGAQNTGDAILGDITKGINSGTKALNDNADGVRKFFADSRQVLNSIIRVLASVGKELFATFNQERLDHFATFLTQTVIPALGFTSRVVGALTDIFLQLLDVPLIGHFFQIVFVVALLGKTFTGIQKAVGIFGFNIAEAVHIVERMTTRMPRAPTVCWTGMFDALGRIAGRIPGLGRLGEAFTRLGDRMRTTGRQAEVTNKQLSLPIKQPTAATVARSSATSRIGQVGKGAAGAAGVALFAAQLAPQNAQENFRGARPTNLDQANDVANSAASLNIPQFFRSLTRDARGASDNMRDFGRTADRSLEQAAGEHNERKLRALGDRARGLAKDFPAASDSLLQFADKADQAAAKAKQLNDLIRRVGSAGANVKTGSILPSDIDDPQLLRRLYDTFDNIKKYGASSIGSLRDIMSANMRSIHKSLRDGSQSSATAMADNFGAGIVAVRKSMNNGSINVRDGMREIGKITRDQMRFARNNMDTLSAQGKERLSANFNAAMDAVRSQMRRGTVSTREGMQEIRRLMRQNLQLYGFNEHQAENVTKGLRPDGGPNEGSANIRRAGGGSFFFGKRGQQEHDSPRYRTPDGGMAAGGEAFIANQFHQRAIDYALQSQFGYGLPQLFERTHGLHRGGFDDYPGVPRHAAGRIGRMVGAAQKLENAHFPYVWGGGHNSSPVKFGPVDCSGAVSYVLQQGGVPIPTMVSGQLARSGSPGPGTVTVFANPEHTLMRLGKRFFGTSGSNPGGGAGWIDPAPSGSYLSRFAQRHFDVTGKLSALIGAASDGLSVAQLKMPKWKGPGGALGEIGKGALKKIRAAAQKRIEQAAIESMGMGSGNPNLPAVDNQQFPGGVLSQGQVTNIIHNALNILGIDKSTALWTRMLVRQASRESTFNPNAVNRTDINAIHGDPSKGLLQVTGSNFSRYHVGNHNNIFNPLDNTLASIRYIIATYGGGNAERAAAAMFARGGGAYRDGGPVRGYLGGAIPGYGGGDIIPAAVEPGEHIWTKEEVMRAGGHGVLRALRRVIGGGGLTQGSGGRFAGGGSVGSGGDGGVIIIDSGTTATKRKRQPPPIDTSISTDFDEIAREANVLVRALRKVDVNAKKGLAKFRSSINPLIRENGVLDKMNEALQKANDAMASQLALATFHITRGGNVIRALNPAQVAQRSLNNLVVATRGIMGERGVIQKALADVADELHNTRGIRDKSDRQAARDQLRGIQRRLQDRLAANDQELAQNLQDRAQAQEDLQRALVEQATKPFETVLKGLDRMLQDASDRGDTAAASAVRTQQQAQRQAEVDALNQQIANLRGNQADQDLIQEVVDQRDDILAAMQQSVRDSFQAVVDDINARAQRATENADIMRQLGDLFGNGGLVDGAFNVQRAALWRQQQELIAQLQNARNSGFIALADQIQQQIDQLGVAIATVTRDQLQGYVDFVNSVAEQRTNAADRRNRVAQALGLEQEVVAAAADRAFAIQDQIRGLIPQMEQAQREGLTPLANTISEQIADLNVQLIELAAENLQTQIQRIEDDAQRALDNADRQDRMATALGVIGLNGPAGASRASAFQQRGSALQQERLALQQTLLTAQMQGNQGAVRDLTAKIADLNVSIAENTRAQVDARIEEINNRAQATTSLENTRRQIIESQAQLNGQTDQAGLLASFQRDRAALVAQGNQLSNELSIARANGDQQRTQELQQAVADNTLAQLQNTIATRELTGEISPEQTFSSTAWTLFREAIFNGAGQLLPQYNVVGASDLRPVASQAAMTAPGAGQSNVNVDLNVANNYVTEDADPNRLAMALGYQLRNMR
jgi:hypothetical protein